MPSPVGEGWATLAGTELAGEIIRIVEANLVADLVDLHRGGDEPLAGSVHAHEGEVVQGAVARLTVEDHGQMGG